MILISYKIIGIGTDDELRLVRTRALAVKLVSLLHRRDYGNLIHYVAACEDTMSRPITDLSSQRF